MAASAATALASGVVVYVALWGSHSAWDDGNDVVLAVVAFVRGTDTFSHGYDTFDSVDK